MKYDFSGWATKNDILCTDGRTIRKDAFKDCDGKTVPLVWNHQHDDPENVLGKALLHNADEGVYAYCSFNETRKAQSAKLAVEHGDYDSLSIYATRLKQNGGDVLHGEIKEVSLVLAGANSGAHINNVIRHGEIFEDEIVIYADEMIDLGHGDSEEAMKAEEVNEESVEEKPAEEQQAEEVKTQEEEPVAEEKTEEKVEEVAHADQEPEKKEEVKAEKTVADVVNTFNKKQKDLLYAFIGIALSDDGETDEAEETQHADKAEAEATDDSEETVEDILNTMTEEQKNVFYLLVGQARMEAEKANAKHSDEETSEEAEVKHNDSENTEGGNKMEYNLFENTNANTENTEVLSHAEQVQILDEAKKNGKLSDAILAHSITSISEAAPGFKTIAPKPELISENQGWVSVVMRGVHHTPFARIKTLFADITPDEARAKGYVTGTEKVEEVIGLAKRETPPTTVYKLQKLNRDDVLDITDFDVVAWLKNEMEIKLNEERARAYLIGDGRGISDPYRIDPQKIRPIWTTESLFVVSSTFTVGANDTDEDIAKGIVRAAVKGFDEYDGSGNTVAFIPTDRLSDIMLLEDGFGHRLYKSKAELATAMLVDSVVGVPVMKNKTRTVESDTLNLDAIIVDLRDYNVGTDKGGNLTWFDNFDIDFNKLEYLIEARESGTLVKPKSAIVVEHKVGE